MYALSVCLLLSSADPGMGESDSREYNVINIAQRRKYLHGQ